MAVTHTSRTGKTERKRGGGLQYFFSTKRWLAFCPGTLLFRGSVDDRIPIGAPDRIEKLAVKYLKPLGRDFGMPILPAP